VIREVEKGVKKKSEIPKDFGIQPKTLSTIFKNTEKCREVKVIVRTTV
jgi:hypothetical protein